MITFVSNLKNMNFNLASITAGSVAVVVAMVLSTQLVQAQQYKKITRLGTSEAMCKGGVQTKAQLQEYFANNPSAINAVLADSGWAGSSQALMAAVANGEFTERAFPVGTKMAWMGAHKDGRYTAMPYREWAGSKSFEAFEVSVSSGCQLYQIAIPKACCNVSLLSVAPDESTECLAAADAAARKASSSNDLAAASDAMQADQSSKSSARDALKLTPFFGIFAGTETRPRYEPRWAMDMRDSSGIAGVRAGLKKGISDRTSIFTQISYYSRSGINEPNIYPKENFAIDIGMERKLSEKAFIGGGIGAWNVDDSDFRDTSLFGHVGGDIGKSNLQWFLEGRVFDSDSMNHDSISDNKMFSAGVRYIVK